MFSLLGQLLEHLVMGMCLSSLSFLFFSLGSILRLLPRLFPLLRRALRNILIYSYRFYNWIMTGIEPSIKPWVGFSLFSGFPRILTCICISILIVLAITALFHWSWLKPCLLTGFVHGLVVGIVWNDVEEPAGFRYGGDRL